MGGILGANGVWVDLVLLCFFGWGGGVGEICDVMILWWYIMGCFFWPEIFATCCRFFLLWSGRRPVYQDMKPWSWANNVTITKLQPKMVVRLSKCVAPSNKCPFWFRLSWHLSGWWILLSSSLVNQLDYSNALLVSTLRFGEIAIGLSSTRGQATGFGGRVAWKTSQGSYKMGTYQL